MATTVNQRTDTGTGRPDSESYRPSPRRGGGGWIFLIVLAVAALGGIALFSPQFANLAGISTSNETTGALTHTVTRGRLLITITEDGNVESAQNEQIKCQIAGGATILWIVEDGKIVQKGDEIVRLDQSQLEDELNAQKIVYEKALATKIQAEEDFEAAKIAVREYKDGTYLQQVQDSEASIIIAKQNLSSAQNLLKHTTRMARKGFATQLQLETDQFAVQTAELELKSAETAKKTLTDFTYAKTLKQLEATRDAAEAHKRSEQAAFDLEKARLERLQAQLKHCVIIAPQGGMVVYANETGRRMQQQPQVEEGAVVREGQDIIRLPDLANMQVKVTVHESKVDLLRTGMPARIKIQDREFDGSVVAVANQPEPGSWMSSNIKEYATTVAIDGTTEGLKPGMTAEVEILIANLQDVVIVPVAAVVEQRGKFFSWIETPNGPERRPLVLGKTNDKDIEIKDGLKVGDVVLLNPRAVVPEARKEDIQVEESAEKRFKNGTVPEDDQDSGAPSKKDGKRGKGKGRPGGSNLMQFDKDGDGKVSKEEAPEQMSTFFDRLDSNGDGFIDASEVAAAAARFQNKGGKGGPPGGGPSE